MRLSGFIGPLLSRALGAVLTVGLTLYLARLFGLEYSGQFFLMLSTIAVLGLLTRLGAEQVLTVEVAPRATYGDDAYEVVFRVFGASSIYVGAAALPLLGFFSFANFHTSLGMSSKFSAIPLAGAVLVFNLTWIMGAYFRARDRPTLAIWFESVLFPAWLMLWFCFAYLLDFRPTMDRTVVSILLLGSVLLGVMVARFRAGGLLAKMYRGSLSHLAKLARFASVAVTNSVIVWMPIQVLGIMGSLSGVAVYNAGFRVAMVVGALGVLVKSSVIRSQRRRIMQKSYSQVSLYKRTGVAMVPFLAVTIAASAVSPQIADAFGSGFGDLSIVLPVMLLAQSVNVAAYVVETELVLADHKRTLRRNAIGTAALALATTPVLVAQFDLWGAVAAFVVTVICSRGALLFIGARTLSMSSKETIVKC